MSAAESLLLEPWVVATPGLWPRLSATALEHSREAFHLYDPTRLSSESFLDRLDRLDELTFGPHGLRMPRWAFYDCAELPGALFGFGTLAERLPEHAESVGARAGEFFPLSLCMATPMVRPAEWLVFSISSLLELGPHPAAADLSLETLALTLAALEPRRIHGTLQWSSPNLAVHAHFAPLEVRAAWVPAHTHAETCVFAFDVDPARIERASREPLPTSGGTPVDPGDHAELVAMQRRIERGEELFVVGATDREHGARALVRWGKP